MPFLDHFGEDYSAIARKKLFLLDMDGTIYEENRLFPKTKDFLAAITAVGGRYLYITNNSSRSVTDYVKKISSLGLEADEKLFFTSSQATAIHLNHHFPGQTVFCMGTHSLVRELSNAGIDVTTDIDRLESIDVVLIGYDSELTYEKLSRVCFLLSQKDRRLPYLATNCDLVCPCNFGFVPDCGSFAEMIAHATGRRPYFIGKPEPTMIHEAIALSPFSAAETCVVGDRLYTDIAAGLRAGVCTVCVLSGEADLEAVRQSEFKPTYTVDSVADLLRCVAG